MAWVTDYAIVQRMDSASVTAELTRLLAKGWQPYGPPFEAGNGVAQAVVKYSDPEADPFRNEGGAGQ